MKITNINVRRTFTEGKLKALISITIDNCLAVHEIKIIQGEARLFVAMPNRMDANGVFWVIFVTESILPLLNGMVIYLADDEQVISQKALSKLISESGAQVLQTTPTKMRGYLFDKNELGYLSVLRAVILGGEELSLELCA